MWSSAKGIAIAVTCLAGLSAGQILSAPCYGYGNIIGQPGKYLEDDYEKVAELLVGQGSTYVSNINYFFEGKNHLQFGYKKSDDPEFRAHSIRHGVKTNVKSRRYNLRDNKSRMLSPGAVINQTLQRFLGYMFVERYDNGIFSVSDPWVISSFTPRKEPYYQFVDEVQHGLKETSKFYWAVDAQVNSCQMIDAPGKTQVVGFATTIDKEDAKFIRSMQPIYFSDNDNYCQCLSANPTMSKNTVRIVPPPTDEDFLEELQRKGTLGDFVNLLGSVIAFVILMAIVIGILCFFSRKKESKKQCSFEPYVYIDLAARTEMRVKNMDKEIVKVQKHGYKPPVKKPKEDPAMTPDDKPKQSSVAEVTGDMGAKAAGGDDVASTKRKSRRSKKESGNPDDSARALMDESATKPVKKKKEGGGDLLEELEEIMDDTDQVENPDTLSKKRKAKRSRRE